MKTFWKVVGFIVLGVLILGYLGFLFVLPRVVDLDKFKPEIQKLAKEQANLDIDFKNPQIITTPLLGAGIKSDEISVKLPDGSTLFSADNLKTRISIPSLFLLTVKVSCFEVEKPFVNLEIGKDNFKIVTLVEDILNSDKEEKLEEAKPVPAVNENSSFAFDPSWIRIKVPNVKLKNYKVLVNDLNSKHYLDLHGEELALGYFNGKTAKIKTHAELFSDENKNVDALIDVNTFLPKVEPKLDSEDDPAERIEIPFVNPVSMYRNYDLKANIDTKLRVRNHNDRITSYGHANINNITLKIENLKLPESYFRAETFGTNVNLDTNIYPAQGQNIQLLGKLNYGHHPKMDMSIKTGKIQFNDLVILSRAFLDFLHIKNELASIKAEGGMQADCYIKTNFKKLNSNGSFIVKDGGVSVRNLGKVLSRVNINVLLDNNALNIKDSSIFVSNSPIYINGKIDDKSVADISVKSDKIPLPILFNAFAPQAIRNSYNFKSGDANVDLSLAGELKKATVAAKFGLANFNFADRANNFVLADEKLAGEFFTDNKMVLGKVDNSNFSITLPKTKSRVQAPKFNLELADNNINIKENSILFNDKSSVKYSGSVVDYEKLESINFAAQGNVHTDDLIKLIGREMKPFIHSQGSIPVKLTVDGNGKKQTLFVQALSDKDNFITPVDFNEIIGKNISLQSIVDFKSGRIKIKKTGLFERNVTVDDEGNEVVHLNEILGVDGTIAGERINLMKITMPKALNGKIYVFPQSSFTLNGRAFVLGETSAPRLRGGYELNNLSIPELFLTLANAKLQFKGDSADVEVKDLLLNNSDIQAKASISLVPASVVNVLNLNVSSRYLNVDKLMAVSERAMRYVPASTPAQASSTASADIPVVIRNGSINMTRIVSGNINIQNTTSRISMARNILHLRGLRTNIFGGNVWGNISVNPLTMLLNVRVQGQGVDVDQALRDACAMKDTLSGTASFKTDISLKGATYEEQVKSLKGTVDFKVTDGQFGPFGKIENLIIAENIRESQFFQTALGGVISGLTTIDTTHFSDLSGHLKFLDGICYIDPITSLGNILSLHIFGDFDILRNYADMKVRARMASLVSNLLGPIGAINPANLLNSAMSLNVFTAKAFSFFCEMVPEDEIAILPSFANSYVDNAATKFQLVVRGDAAKPLTLIKSFKWLATATEYQNAVDYVNSLPEPVEGSEAETIEQAIEEAQALEAEKKTLKYKVKHLFKRDKDK